MRYITTIYLAAFLAGSCDRDGDISYKTLDFGNFTIEVPSTWESVDQQGYDSFVGQISINDQEKVNFDLGWYSNKLDVDPSMHEISWTTIDARKAKRVRANDPGDGTTGVYFDSLEETRILKFQMSGTDLTPANQAHLLIATGTLKFRSLDDQATDIPSCVEQMIEDLESEPVRNPPASVWRVQYDGQTAYYIPPYCCDMYSELFDADCEFICSPDGGITGQGDGKCTAMPEKAMLIWKDLR